MVDTPSDSSTGASAAPRPNHIRIDAPNHDAEKGLGNGYMFTGERKHSRAERDDDEDEDLDMLIEELESVDPEENADGDVEVVGGHSTVPEELLQTDTREGLIEPEVVQRRKKYGLNQMKEERENLFLKFLGYFVGPIQFVMEVCGYSHTIVVMLTLLAAGCCYPCRWSRRLGRLRRHLCSTSAERHCWFPSGIPSRLHR